MRRLGWMLVLLCVGFLAAGSGASASGPRDLPSVADGDTVTIRYQGRLEDPDGVPITGTVLMEYRVYNSRTGGTELWASGPLQVGVESGLFSVSLLVDRGLFDGRRMWLAAYVEGQTLSPRQEVAAVPYAAGLVPGVQLVSDDGDSVFSVTNNGSGGGLVVSTARGYGLEVQGGGTCAVYVEQSGDGGHAGHFVSESGTGVYGESQAVSSETDSDGAGVYGYSVDGHGVYGVSSASDRSGVRGFAAAGTGVEGEAVSGTALSGATESGTGLSVRSVTGTGAEVTSSAGTALVAVSESTDAGVPTAALNAQAGRAVEATSAHGTAVWAETGSVQGLTVPLSPVGVVGLGESRGVYGGAATGPGVEGVSVDGYGVRGVSGMNYAGYFVSDSYRGLYAANLSGSSYDAYFGGDVGIKVESDVIVGGSKSGYVIDVMLNAGDESLERGDVVEVVGVTTAVLGDIPVPLVRKATRAESPAVVGVVDRRYVVACGGADASPGHLATSDAVIASGDYCGVVTLGSFAEIKVDAGYGSIAPGDLLVASPNPGYAMRDDEPKVGSVVAKALGTLEEGCGPIPAMIALQ